MLSTACKRFASFKAVRGLHNAAPIKPSHHPRITQLLIDGKVRTNERKTKWQSMIVNWIWLACLEEGSTVTCVVNTFRISLR